MSESKFGQNTHEIKEHKLWGI